MGYKGSIEAPVLINPSVLNFNAHILELLDNQTNNYIAGALKELNKRGILSENDSRFDGFLKDVELKYANSHVALSEIFIKNAFGDDAQIDYEVLGADARLAANEYVPAAVKRLRKQLTVEPQEHPTLMASVNQQMISVYEGLKNLVTTPKVVVSVVLGGIVVSSGCITPGGSPPTGAVIHDFKYFLSQTYGQKTCEEYYQAVKEGTTSEMNDWKVACPDFVKTTAVQETGQKGAVPTPTVAAGDAGVQAGDLPVITNQYGQTIDWNARNNSLRYDGTDSKVLIAKDPNDGDMVLLFLMGEGAPYELDVEIQPYRDATVGTSGNRNLGVSVNKDGSIVWEKYGADAPTQEDAAIITQTTYSGVRAIQVEIKDYIRMINNNHIGEALIDISKKESSSDKWKRAGDFSYDKTRPMLRDK